MHMRVVYLLSLIALVLSSCTSRQTFVGKTYKSQSEFENSLRNRWSLVALESYCTPARKADEDRYIQPPIMFGARNWEGEFKVGPKPDQFQVHWVAIAIRGRVEAYLLTASKGTDSWHLAYAANPKLPFFPEELKKLIRDGEDNPK